MPLCLLPFGAGMLGRYDREPVALRIYGPGLCYLLAFLVAQTAPALSLLIYAAMPVLYFLSITILRSSRTRNREYEEFTQTSPRLVSVPHAWLAAQERP
jgi:threonine/homoserine/homoserine lactone efflux protein